MPRSPHYNLPERLRGVVINQAFATIDDIVRAMDKAHVFPEEEERAVVTKWKKAEARRLVRQMKDDSGWPLFFNIVIQDQKGHKQRVYAQEALFDLQQYRQAITYFKGVSVQAAATANELARRARRRLKLKSRQLPLPFPEMEEEAKG